MRKTKEAESRGKSQEDEQLLTQGIQHTDSKMSVDRGVSGCSGQTLVFTVGDVLVRARIAITFSWGGGKRKKKKNKVVPAKKKKEKLVPPKKKKICWVSKISPPPPPNTKARFK